MTAINPAWYCKEGGPVLDTTVYVLHTLTGILGPVRRVSAMSGKAQTERFWKGQRIPVNVDDNTLMMLDFGDARFAVVGGHAAETGRLVDWGSFGIYGNDGVIEALEIEPMSGLPDKLHLKSSRLLQQLGGKTEGTYLAGALSGIPDAHHGMREPHVYADILHCVRCIRGKETVIASGHTQPMSST